MSNERLKILEMISEGKITPNEAEKLLQALEASVTTKASTTKDTPRFIVVKVDPKSDGGDKVNIRVPLQVLRAGMKLASFLPGAAKEKIDEKLKEKGVNFDINQVTPENLEELIKSFSDLTVDVDGQNEKVKIFCE
ncbi:MAG: hypothetical protein HQK51_18810 [Oligoflexia bacterium]|nr:hypothetical protein [Oligoflexia bacterium]